MSQTARCPPGSTDPGHASERSLPRRPRLPSESFATRLPPALVTRKNGSPSRRTWRRIPPGCIRLFLELRGDDIGSFEIHRVVDHCSPHDDGRAVRFLEQIDVLEQW